MAAPRRRSTRSRRAATSAWGSRASKVPVRPLAASSSASSRRSRLGEVAVDQRVAGPAPEDSPQLRAGVEADAVVDGPEPPIGVPEAVRTLPIRVVDDGVEHGKGSNVLAGGVHHGDGPAGRGLPEKVPIQPGGTWPSGTRSTTRSSASGENGSPIQRWTDPGPSGPSRRTVGGTSRQPPASDTRWAATPDRRACPPGSPTAALSPTHRLVDGVGAVLGEEPHQHRQVGRVGDSSYDLEIPEQRSVVGRRAEVAVSDGSHWPAGRCGPSGRGGHRRRGRGRPAATMDRLRRASARLRWVKRHLERVPRRVTPRLPRRHRPRGPRPPRPPRARPGRGRGTR